MNIPQLDHVLEQIRLAEPELQSYLPAEVDWITRSQENARRLVPWLVQNASGLCSYVSKVMNSPVDVRSVTARILSRIEREQVFSDDSQLREDFESLRSALQHETLLIAGAGGTVVSKLIERYLIANSSDWVLESNGASDYPDLFFRSDDYSDLPVFKRRSDVPYGAAVKGKAKRPVRIPDGLEIKTCRRTFSVDCHHAHVGLHVVLLFERQQESFVVRDVLVGFMRHSLYRITVPASPTTTLKASFNGHHFVSLLMSDPESENCSSVM